uniref:Uncharacterized protein n=1 Tax=virus sp. ct1Uu26 TaxID=2826789 RepID=A0A8S5R966_9VIRU|nr:MAG TPA: hypothetical protein [virus sp. ct1Uu26]
MIPSLVMVSICEYASLIATSLSLSSWLPRMRA